MDSGPIVRDHFVFIPDVSNVQFAGSLRRGRHVLSYHTDFREEVL